ncbi:MAG: hypothetical protein ABSF72_05885 [Candidatus Sulfotelmatobacter sp.]
MTTTDLVYLSVPGVSGIPLGMARIESAITMAVIAVSRGLYN